jgi:hypothetical protein
MNDLPARAIDKRRPQFANDAARGRLVPAVGLFVLTMGLATTPLQKALTPETEAHPAASGTLTGNQARFEALSGNELEELQNRKRRFEQLPVARQQHLRAIHQQWSQHTDREALLDTMRQYTKWLKSLNAEQRAEIRSVTGDRRVELVSEIRRQQAEAIFGIAGETQLPKEDVSVLFRWSSEFLKARQTQIVELFRARSNAPEGRRGGSRGFESRPDLLFVLLGRNRENAEAVVGLIEDEDIARLKERLSPEAVAIIENQGDPSDKKKLVYRWIVSAIDALRNPDVPERDLREFFDTEMTTEQRQRVEAMTPEFRLQAIRSFYLARNRQQLAPGLFPQPAGPDFRRPRNPESRNDPLPPDGQR